MRDPRPDFPFLSRTVGGRPLTYLDSAATSLKPRVVIDAVTAFYRQHTSNVHRAVHAVAEEATEAFDATRGQLAQLLNAEPAEIVYLRGTTEAANLVRRGLPGLRRTAATALDHHSTLVPFGLGEGGTVIGIDADAKIDMDQLERELRRGLDLVAVAHVSNALGTLQPIEEVIELAHAHGALVFVDAAQSAPHRPLDVRALDADFVGLSAHKMCAPGGVGCLYGKAELLEGIEPWQLGGHVMGEVHLGGYTVRALPERLEPGTPPIEAVIGWSAALSYLDRLGMEEIRNHDHSLAGYAHARLRALGGVHVAGPSDSDRLGAAVSFWVDGRAAEEVARSLSADHNVLVRSGFHCAQPLHEVLGLPPTVRASFYLYNTREDVDRLAESLEALLRIP